MRTEHLCCGPDGGQLLGFLCALGLVEAASHALPEHRVAMGFSWHEVGWRPVLVTEPTVGRGQLTESLQHWIAAQATSPALTRLGDDLPCAPEQFLALAREAGILEEREVSDYLAAFGVARDHQDKIDDTAFRTMSGAGHQHFLGFARTLTAETTREHVEKALFARWTYEDPRPTLRFDSLDDRRYALRADNPASGSSSAPIRTVRAANALAFEGLRLLPVVPAEGGGVATTLTAQDGRSLAVRWPIWERPIRRDVVAGLVAHPAPVGAPGVACVFECRRITIGKFRGFTPARRVM